MAAAKPGKGSSLTSLAATLDTRKRPLPGDARPPSNAARARIVAALPARANPAPASKAAQVASKPEHPPAATKAPVGSSKATAAPVKKPVAVAAVVSRPVATRRPEPDVRTSARPEVPVARRAEPVSPPTRPPESLSRSNALTSLRRDPSPLPSRFPALGTSPAAAPATAKTRRKYPRAQLSVRARLSLADDPSRSFEAALPTVDISVGGMFLESSFFLKMGTKLLVTLSLPPKGREVKVKGEVVRVVTQASGESGFALRFTEYLDGSEVALATHFLSPLLREFITGYAKQHRFDASPEYVAHTADVLAAWELRKAELGSDIWALTGAR